MCRRIASLVSLVTALVVGLPAVAQAAPVPPRVYTAAIEPYAAYSPQTTCSPTAKPGTTALKDLLLRTYPWTRSLGIVRACSVGGRSEHKEGRAFDWGVNVTSTRDVQAVNDFFLWLFRTDKYGNKHAMARRLGVQYVIWNHKIWGSYAVSQGWRTYTGASPHTDPVHISLSWPGANKTTSFWTGKVGSTTAPPPGGDAGTTPMPDDDQVSEPQPPATLLPGAPLSSERLYLDARRLTGVTTAGALQAGQPYLVESVGTYQYKATGARADAQCSNTALAPRTWLPSRSLDPRHPDTDHLDLYLNGIDPRMDADSGEHCDPLQHTYRWTYVPSRTGRANFRVWDARYSDNAGGLSIRVRKLSTDDSDQTVVVRGAAPTGATGNARYRAGVEYVVQVTGTWQFSPAGVGDADCVRTAAGWSRTLASGADFTGLLVNSWDPDARPLADTGGGCDGTGHVYRFRWTPREDTALSAKVSDGLYRDNTGTLFVRVVRRDLASRLPGPPPEQVTVDTALSTGVQTVRSYADGAAYEITVAGTYDAGAGVTADAECSATTADATWRGRRSSPLSTRLLWDATVNGETQQWQAVEGGDCSPSHTYRLVYRPGRDGRLRLGVRDVTFADNSGSLNVSVRQV
jgi:hypothetical protein